MEATLTYKIGIIGFGPKGFYGFERLIAYLKEVSIARTIEIHVFNNNRFFAAGDVYRLDQPDYLIMNYANRNINSWALLEPMPAVNSIPDFVSWLKSNGCPDAGLGEYAPRAVVGEYLVYCFKSVVEQLPKNIKVVTHIGLVTNVDKEEDKFKLTGSYKDLGNEFSLTCHNLLFTTGHSSFKSQLSDNFRTENSIHFIYPTNKKLKHIAYNATVAIKGFGLTAIDAILELTEGRGGVFKKNEKGILHYCPSGNEPKCIYPFSRTGLPMIPRNGSPTSNTILHYLTEEVARNLRENGPVSFNSTLLPLIKKEFYFAFYSVLFKTHGQELNYDEDFTVIENQVNYFHKDNPGSSVFNWETIINPFINESVLSNVVLQVYIEFLINEAQLGDEKSPLMAAVAVWRKISPIFNQLYSFGGLDAASHREFDTYYFGLFNRLAYGPPIKNMQKMLALVKAGLLDFTYAKSATIKQNDNDDNFILQLKDGEYTEINYLINATIQRGQEDGFKNELYQNLLRNGIIRRYENKLNTCYRPGCLELNDKGHPIDSKGNAITKISFYGTPTEGITFDNDTLSRTRNDFASTWAKSTCDAIVKGT